MRIPVRTLFHTKSSVKGVKLENAGGSSGGRLLAYQHVDGAAHAVLLVLVVHDGPVVQQPLH